MYQVTRTVIKKTEYPEYCSYFSALGMFSTNLYNAGLFRVRQNFTIRGKEHPSDLELQVQKEIELTVKEKHTKKPKSCLSYEFLEKLMRVTENPDFFAGLPMQLAQNVIKQACRDFKSWIASVKEYKKSPDKFLGFPQMPRYKKKASVSGLHFTNQDCVIYNQNGKFYLKFPHIHGEYLPIGYVSGSLKEVRVKPYYGNFLVICVYETETTEPLPENGNACGIDFGISNIVALVSNTQKCMLYKGGALKALNQWYNKQEPLPENGNACGIDFGISNIVALVSNTQKCMLYKGGALKALNQWYNKQRAYYQSIAMQGHDVKKAKRLGLLHTKRLEQLNRDRSQFFHDALHKIASDVVNFCLQNDIRTIVLGKNKNWKQNANIGRKNNQTFVQMPIATLSYFIKYKAEANGLLVVEQEESYTSKASLVDGDNIPVYGENTSTTFSGERMSRGLYCTKDQMVINADLNGAGNILRKAYPSAFNGVTDYNFLNKMIVKKYNTMYSSNG